MKTVVSRGKLFIDGKPACIKCARRPRRWSGHRWQSYCKECHTEYMTAWREYQKQSGSAGMRLSAEERELILELRQVQPAGRHHAGLCA